MKNKIIYVPPCPQLVQESTWVMCLKAQGDYVEYLVQLEQAGLALEAPELGCPRHGCMLRYLCAETLLTQMCSCTELGFYRLRFKMQSSAFPPPFTLFVLLFHTIWHQRLSNVAPQANGYKWKSATCCWQNSSLIPNHSSCLHLHSPEKPLILVPWSTECVIYLQKKNTSEKTEFNCWIHCLFFNFWHKNNRTE